MEPAPQDGSQPEIELCRFQRLSDARERGLVLSACGVTHSIAREGEEWLIRVDLADFTKALGELTAYETELSLAAQSVPEAPRPRVSFWSLPLVALALVGFAVIQAELGESWMSLGILSADLVIAKHHWWRTITALTLHGDVPHVIANLGAGLLFGGLLIPSFGQGLTWLLVLLSGALGNALTAWAYFPESHRNVGASTAVFGALGLLVGDSLGLLLQSRGGRSWWRWVPPLGAGLSLLAFLGSGEGKANVDVLAHLWGFAAGFPIGFLVAFLKPAPDRPPLQAVAGLGALGLLGCAWALASS